jgi:dTDP-4-amino-4,6-dideoxygalactose transaminase
MPLVRQQLKLDVTSGKADLVFVDDLPQAPFLNGHRVISYAKWGHGHYQLRSLMARYVGVQRPWQKLRGYVWATHPPGFRWQHESLGTNWRILEMQAVLGRIQLKRMA